jgi:hypothetical protein
VRGDLEDPKCRGEVLIALQESVECFVDRGQPELIAAAALLLARVLVRDGRRKEAMIALDTAAQAFSAIKNDRQLAETERLQRSARACTKTPY